MSGLDNRRMMGPERTLEECIALWERLIAEIREGYEDCSAGYDNDVDIRTVMQRKLDDARGDTDEDLLRKIYALDQEFLAQTRECKRPPRRPEYWWKTRVPLRPGPELTGALALYDE
jgi:hypothetical protein